ncbi:MAG: DNA-primase RepB domain-containing protein [Minwuia sp.]|uniref:DNA-primase RepB domain-containing protein n=1 Tax=Minwuia sp. TaxID=2493630 RepID=UPI003A8405E9
MSDFPPDVMARFMTNRAIEQTTVALLDRQYIVRLVHREGWSPENPTISRHYTVCDLRKPGTTKYLRYMNWQGYHVFFRPEHPGYVRVDDLCEDVIDRMRADEIDPCAVIETSEGLFHAWIRLMRWRSTVITPAENGAAARLLAERYGGDMGASGAMQVGRLPGFRNVKGCHEDRNGGFPLVRLRSKSGGRAAECILKDARQNLSRSSTMEAHGTAQFLPEQQTFISLEMREPEAAAIYRETVKDLVSRFPNLPVTDRSRVNYAVAGTLTRRGYQVPEVVAVIAAGSDKALERGAKYVERTVEAARKKLGLDL